MAHQEVCTLAFALSAGIEEYCLFHAIFEVDVGAMSDEQLHHFFRILIGEGNDSEVDRGLFDLGIDEVD